MEIGIYRPEGEDLQQPHEHDEVYFITTGSGQFEHAGSTDDVAAGDVLFVAAGDHHRLVDFSEDFATRVILYGPPGGE
jgi:mannose-6-phosphate isomerase-like protein (cupin superfamily)